jgi:DUF1365 family protein
MESFLYEGTMRHRRFTAPSRSFTYSLFMMYLDLGELDAVFARRWFWSTRAPNLAWFRRADHYGDPSIPLDAAIRDLVAERTGVRPEGPIRLLTHLRYLGHGFNPVSFYYCFATDGRTLETIVAEVSNTPWNERHMYVLPEAENRGRGDAKRYDFKKAFHVSPFLGMDHDYGWRFGTPPTRDGDKLWVHMENRKGDARVFEATLSLERRPITGAELARAVILRPAMTVQVVASIYWQALRLWVRRARFYPHPRTQPARQP